MTISAVGSPVQTTSTSGGTVTATVSPTAIGDILVFSAACFGTGDGQAAVAVTGGGVTTWNSLNLTGNADLWWGIVTATGPQAFSAYILNFGSGVLQQFTGGGAGTWSTDSVNYAGTAGVFGGFTTPSLSPTNPGELTLVTYGTVTGGGSFTTITPSGFSGALGAGGNVPVFLWGVSPSGSFAVTETPFSSYSNSFGYVVGFLIFTSSVVATVDNVMVC